MSRGDIVIAGTSAAGGIGDGIADIRQHRERDIARLVPARPANRSLHFTAIGEGKTIGSAAKANRGAWQLPDSLLLFEPSRWPKGRRAVSTAKAVFFSALGQF
jgi:hypothetical protein